MAGGRGEVLGWVRADALTPALSHRERENTTAVLCHRGREKTTAALCHGEREKTTAALSHRGTGKSPLPTGEG
ncbi:hypothetical protein C1N60_04125 [Pantoea sp. SGAir0184]